MLLVSVGVREGRAGGRPDSEGGVSRVGVYGTPDVLR